MEFFAQLAELIHQECRTTLANLENRILWRYMEGDEEGERWYYAEEFFQKLEDIHQWMARFMNDGPAWAYVEKDDRWYVDFSFRDNPNERAF